MKPKYLVLVLANSLLICMGIFIYVQFRPHICNDSRHEIVVGVLSKVKGYTPFQDYLSGQLWNKCSVRIEGDETISYKAVNQKLLEHTWDIVFAYSPMVSIMAKDHKYTFVARMFPESTAYYKSALFVANDSPIHSLDDITESTKLALGDEHSASSFYMPLYDLYGKTLNITVGNRSQVIKDMVTTGKADVGAAAMIALKDESRIRIIRESRDIPGSNVYLSPDLKAEEKVLLTHIILNAPLSITKEANYGPGVEPDYTEFRKINEKVSNLLECVDLNARPIKLFCS